MGLNQRNDVNKTYSDVTISYRNVKEAINQNSRPYFFIRSCSITREMPKSLAAFT